MEILNGLNVYLGDYGNNPCVRLHLKKYLVIDQFYDDAERLRRIDYANGSKQFYKGERGAEYKEYTTFENGDKWFFDGVRGAERKVRIEFPDGNKWFFDGKRGAEHLVRAEFKDGDKQFFLGVKGAERRMRTEHADDRMEFFEGDQGRIAYAVREAKRVRTRSIADGDVLFS